MKKYEFSKIESLQDGQNSEIFFEKVFSRIIVEPGFMVFTADIGLR